MPSPQVTQANLAQGSAPPLTPTCHYLLYNLVTSRLTCIIKEQRHQPIKNISYLGLTEKILNSQSQFHFRFQFFAS